MQLIPLADLHEHERLEEADLCIIGAGAAGLYLAHRLEAWPGRVIVLEAGSARGADELVTAMAPEFPLDVYSGATTGRAFGVGGTTSRWGGQLVLPHATDVDREQFAYASAWAEVLRICKLYAPAVAAALDTPLADPSSSRPDTSGQRATELQGAGIATQLSSWMAFRRRNLARLVHSRASMPRVKLFTQAVAAEWQLAPSSSGLVRANEVVAHGPAGRRLRVRAARYVIAAGAIESTRILLEIDTSLPGGVFSRKIALGHSLSDHLSITIGRFAAQAGKPLIRAFVPRFEGSTMRTWRFLPSTVQPADCRYFAHLVFPLDSPGFALLREAFRGIQAGRLVLPSIRSLSLGTGDLVKVAWNRAVYGRLYVDSTKPILMQFDMEQRPDPSNRILLGSRRDENGRLNTLVRWRVSDADRKDLSVAKTDFMSRWERLGTQLQLYPLERDNGAHIKPHDAYHPVGTCRIGMDAEATVDFKLKARGIDNLHVLSTAILPSAGSANPTLTLLCFAEMLAREFADAKPVL